MSLLNMICVGLVLLGVNAAASERSSSELARYVYEMRRKGIKDDQIRQQALRAGWQAATVDATLAPAAAQAQTPAPANGAGDHYRIGAGDVLQIVAWKEPDASVPSVIVRPDGKIAVPLLKEVEVAGLTPPEAERAITERLTKFIPGVDVTVVVTHINSKKAYVVGAVKKEGPVPLLYPMTILQALSEAGGLTDYAKRAKIYVLRNENGKPMRLPFNYEGVIRGEQMEQNIQLQPDDTIVVPQ